ncbi:MAG: hypothetical protein IJ091_00230 [Oscillospiraceae bacterium]|nr:hypothetical protein [Oscillospiraceae bacterium]
MYIIDEQDIHLHDEKVLFSDTLFPDVRKQFYGRHQLPISVVSVDGRLCFNLRWEDEYYFESLDREHRNIMVPECNFHGEDLTEEVDVLDFTFLNQFSSIWFERIDEFSWSIIRLLSKERPHIRLYTDDINAALFPSMYVFSGAPQGEETFLKVFAPHDTPNNKEDYLIYSLMISLTWAKIRHYEPAARHKDTVLRIDCAMSVEGFGDFMRKISIYISLARVHGWIPVICLDHGSQFEDYPGEDCWSKFFAPIGTVAPDEIRDHACWISVHENRKSEAINDYNPCNPYMRLYVTMRPCTFEFRFNEKALLEIEKKAGDTLSLCENAIGTVVRTSDFDWLLSTHTDVDLFFEKASDAAAMGDVPYVFLATETENSLQTARGILKDKLLYIPQNRIREDEYRSGFISDSLGKSYPSKYRFGVDYLTVIACLANCRAIIYNRNCGAVYVAEALRRSLGKKPALITDIRHVSLFPASIGSSRVFLYGAGIRGKTACEILHRTNELIFCDRKAESGEFTVNGCRVISPETLKEIYSGETVVVTPAKGQEEIRSALLTLGIPDEKIFVFSTDNRIITSVENASLPSVAGTPKRIESPDGFMEQLYALGDVFSPGEHVVLYGAGFRGEMVLNNLRSKAHFTFCDRKAASGEYEIWGTRVISPDTLKQSYQGERVVITPEAGREEILDMLLQFGIPREKILIIR